MPLQAKLLLIRQAIRLAETVGHRLSTDSEREVALKSLRAATERLERSRNS